MKRAGPAHGLSRGGPLSLPALPNEIQSDGQTRGLSPEDRNVPRHARIFRSDVDASRVEDQPDVAM